MSVINKQASPIGLVMHNSRNVQGKSRKNNMFIEIVSLKIAILRVINVAHAKGGMIYLVHRPGIQDRLHIKFYLQVVSSGTEMGGSPKTGGTSEIGPN